MTVMKKKASKSKSYQRLMELDAWYRTQFTGWTDKDIARLKSFLRTVKTVHGNV